MAHIFHTAVVFVKLSVTYQYTVAHCTKKTGLKRINTKLSLNATPNSWYEISEIASDTQEKVSDYKHMHDCIT